MTLYLGTETKDEPAAGRLLEVPAQIGEHHGRAGKGYGDAGRQFDPLTGHGRHRQGQKRIVPVFLSGDDVVPGSLACTHRRHDLVQIVIGHASHEPHPELPFPQNGENVAPGGLRCQ